MDRSAYYEEFCRRCKWESLTSEMLQPYPCGEHCNFFPDIGLIGVLLFYEHGGRINETDTLYSIEGVRQ